MVKNTIVIVLTIALGGLGLLYVLSQQSSTTSEEKLDTGRAAPSQLEDASSDVSESDEEVALEDNTVTLSATRVEWDLERVYPDSEHNYEQSVTATVYFNNGSSGRFVVGTAYGCAVDDPGKVDMTDVEVLGFVSCYMAASGEEFVAYQTDSAFIIENRIDDASGRTTGTTKEVLRI